MPLEQGTQQISEAFKEALPDMAMVPSFRINRNGLGLIVPMQRCHVGDEFGIENEQHHLKVQVQAALVQIDGAKETERVVDRDGLGVQQAVCEKGNLDACIH